MPWDGDRIKARLSPKISFADERGWVLAKWFEKLFSLCENMVVTSGIRE
jgi:hypothetical protein